MRLEGVAPLTDLFWVVPLRSITLPVLESSTLPLLSMIRVLGVFTERLSAVLLLPERALRVFVAVLLLPERVDRVADDLPESPAVRELFLLAMLLLYTLLLLPERLCVRLL